MIDIYSRYIVGVRVHARESGPLAESMMREVFDAHGVPHVVHADRGTSMTSKSVADLLEDLQVTRSHSRPKTSNDNPYSEAWFKTLKYAPVFPDRFASLADARSFMTEFVNWYNHAHRHSGIGLHTPPTCTTAATTRSAPAARTPSPRLAPRIRNGSAPVGHCPRSSTCPTRSGSTNPTRKYSPNCKPLNSRWPQSLDTFRISATAVSMSVSGSTVTVAGEAISPAVTVRGSLSAATQRTTMSRSVTTPARRSPPSRTITSPMFCRFIRCAASLRLSAPTWRGAY
ncbi:hypothetical protein FHR83_007639 [Actinoplanes campanulatus]|uniref:Integrase catalytic domain-containing protein n=1 Tax=Actinoplanes campanulatus TaxID=113559 RepID=A0A7W5FIN8_9ACTN|nr:hypothetical protein [Actinoplanes campanulatus]